MLRLCWGRRRRGGRGGRSRPSRTARAELQPRSQVIPAGGLLRRRVHSGGGLRTPAERSSNRVQRRTAGAGATGVVHDQDQQKTKTKAKKKKKRKRKKSQWVTPSPTQPDQVPHPPARGRRFRCNCPGFRFIKRAVMSNKRRLNGRRTSTALRQSLKRRQCKDGGSSHVADAAARRKTRRRLFAGWTRQARAPSLAAGGMCCRAFKD